MSLYIIVKISHYQKLQIPLYHQIDSSAFLCCRWLFIPLYSSIFLLLLLFLLFLSMSLVFSFSNIGALIIQRSVESEAFILLFLVTYNFCLLIVTVVLSSLVVYRTLFSLALWLHPPYPLYFVNNNFKKKRFLVFVVCKNVFERKKMFGTF